MNQTVTYLKVTSTMLRTQLPWTFGFLGIMILVNTFKIITETVQNSTVDNYYNLIFIAANIFMFVLGIMSTYSLHCFVEKGVTRKGYFQGTVLASIGLSIIIPIITIIISTVQQLIVKTTDKISFKPANFNEIVTEVDGDMIGDFISEIVQLIILSPHVDPQSNWFLAISIFSLNIFIYYVIGWLIGTSFYRFDTVIGLISIPTALMILTLTDVLLRITLKSPIPDSFSTLGSLPSGIAILLVVILIIMPLYGIRYMTKRVTINI